MSLCAILAHFYSVLWVIGQFDAFHEWGLFKEAMGAVLQDECPAVFMPGRIGTTGGVEVEDGFICHSVSLVEYCSDCICY